MPKILNLIIFALISIATTAQDIKKQNKIITKAKMIGIGTNNNLDTYLSPLKYKGTSIKFINYTTRENNKKIEHQIIISGDVSYTHNNAETNSRIGFNTTFQYNINKKFLSFANESNKIKFGVGILSNLGSLLSLRGGNNPAQLYADINIQVGLIYEYLFKIAKQKLFLRYEVATPMCGIAFSPNYGQSYYEIFLKKDYDRNIIPTTFINSPSLKQMLTIDIPIKNTILRIGYVGDYKQVQVNKLKQYQYNNLLLLGLVMKFSINKLNL